MSAYIVGGVCDIIKQQPWIVAVLPVLRMKNVLQITQNRQREGSNGTVQADLNNSIYVVMEIIKKKEIFQNNIE